MRGGSRLLLLGSQDVALGRFGVVTCTAAVLHEKPDRHVLDYQSRADHVLYSTSQYARFHQSPSLLVRPLDLNIRS
jgi:hypothetical protein